MSSDDDKKKKPSYRAPDNYSQYGRPGTNDPGSSTAPKTINLGKLPLRVGDLSPGAKSDFAARFGPSKTTTLSSAARSAAAKTPAKRTAPPARKGPAKSSGPSKAVYSGGPNDPGKEAATPTSSTYASQRLVYSEGRPPQDSPTLSRDVPNPLVSGSGSKTLSRDVPNPLVSTKKIDTDRAAKEIADARKSNQSYMPTQTAKAKATPSKKTTSRSKHAYSVKYAKD